MHWTLRVRIRRKKEVVCCILWRVPIHKESSLAKTVMFTRCNSWTLRIALKAPTSPNTTNPRESSLALYFPWPLFIQWETFWLSDLLKFSFAQHVSTFWPWSRAGLNWEDLRKTSQKVNAMSLFKSLWKTQSLSEVCSSSISMLQFPSFDNFSSHK